MATLLDPFVLRERINQAGMGLVWRARQDALVGATEVHLVDPDLAALPALLEHVRHEARRAALRNPSAVIELPGRLPLVVMERVEGTSLAQLLRARGPLDLDHALSLIDQVLGALAALHDGGMVHADLQPASILVDPCADGEVVSLVDFGGAGDLDGTKATEYLAPEVIAGGAPSVASDLYAAGVVMYEVLTGQLPFHGRSAAEVMSRQLRGAAVPIAVCRPDLHIPGGVERACMRAIARSPGVRFGDARAFAEALREATRPPELLPPTAAPGVSIERLRAARDEAIASGVGDAIVDRSLDLALALDRRGHHGEAIELVDATIELVMWDDHVTAADPSALERRARRALDRLHERAGDPPRARRPTR